MDNLHAWAICVALRRKWTKEDGAVALLRAYNADLPVIRVCAGPMENKYLALESVKVWKGDELVYTGPADPKALRPVFTKERVCFAEITTMKDLERDVRGDFICCRDRKRCRSRRCEERTLYPRRFLTVEKS